MSNIQFLGLAHTVPSRQSIWFTARWKEWEPLCTIAARHTMDPADALHKMKVTHHSRLMDLLAAHISWQTIREKRLDNPTISNADFEWHLREAAERRRTRMGRVKGVKRSKV